MTGIVQDLRYAVRGLRRNPGFTAVAVLTLTLGIGANTAMFTVVNTVLLRPLPYHEPSQLVSVQTVDAVRRRPGTTAPPDFYAFRAQNRSLEQLAAYYERPYNLTGDRDPERILTLIVSPGFFTALGVQPSLGRSFVPHEEQWGSHRVAILGDALWRRRFGADQGILGRPITLDGEPYVVLGVLPPTFSFLSFGAQLVVPMSFEPGDHMNSHGNNFLRMIARLRLGISREQASLDLNRISDAIIAEQRVNRGTLLDVAPLREVLARDVRRPVLVLLGAVGFILLIACANLANLLLARAAVRQREIAVRQAMGASRARLLRQFLIESLLLSIAGGGIGLGVAYVSSDLFNLVGPRVLPRAEAIRVDVSVLMFTFAVAVLASIILGLAPALDSVAGNLGNGLQGGTRTSSDPGGRNRVRASLVVAEMALSLVLLVGAGLLVRSMYQLLHVDAGFRADGVLTMQINLPAQKYVDAKLLRQFSPQAFERSVGFFTEVVDRVRTLPNVQAVGAISGLPLMGEVWGKNITFYDRPLPNDFSELPPIQYRVVAGDYFRTLGIRMLSGRAFTDEDTQQAPKVAIVNRELVRRYWNDQDPLGKTLSVNPPLQLLPKSMIEEARRAFNLPDNYEPDRFTVIGVADDVLYGGLSSSPLPLVYVPYSQGSEGTTNMFLVVRSAGEPPALVGAIREQIGQVDRAQPIAAIQTMDERISSSVAQPRLQMSVLGTFALLAVLLAAIGIYGVISYAVTQRAREIGIRAALGAESGELKRMFVRDGVMLAGIGMGVLSENSA
jgi:putative ABC transport system permease protein